MAGLVPAISLRNAVLYVPYRDCRVKPGNDNVEWPGRQTHAIMPSETTMRQRKKSRQYLEGTPR
jgi:hypothetical protein